MRFEASPSRFAKASSWRSWGRRARVSRRCSTSSDGSYLLGEEDVAKLSDTELSRIRNKRLGFIFQSFNLIPTLTVLENIEVPLFYGGAPAKEARARSRALAAKVGLGE